MIFITNHWDSRSNYELIDCATPCHVGQALGLYLGSNPIYLTVLPATPEDYATVPQSPFH